jgi:hypothetical protein
MLVLLDTRKNHLNFQRHLKGKNNQFIFYLKNVQVIITQFLFNLN